MKILLCLSWIVVYLLVIVLAINAVLLFAVCRVSLDVIIVVNPYVMKMSIIKARDFFLFESREVASVIAG